MATFPYAHLNLCRNPFGTLTRPEKNRVYVLRIDLAPYIARLQSPGYALQFLKEGAGGKTTHLLAIRDHFPGAPYVRFYEERPLPPIPDAPVLFLDWLHLLPAAQRRRLLARPAAFAVVSHANHGREFRRAGLQYDLIKLPRFTVDQLAEQIGRRIASVARDPAQPVPTIGRDQVARLHARYHDDFTIFDHLYELFEELEEVGDVRLLD